MQSESASESASPPAAEADPIVVSLAAIAAAVAFVWVAIARDATNGILDVALIVLALIGGALIAHRARGPRPMRVVGIITALGSGWLLLQRADLGAAIILGAFYGAGLGLATRGHDRPRERGWPRSTAVVLLGGLVLLAAYIGAETPDAHWFGGGITRGRTLYGEVALTFDDGPNATATVPIMKILDAADVKGTFFEVGKAIDAYPQITRTLAEHGHVLGNHSYNHDQWRWLDPRYPELERTQDAFQRAIGKCPAYYRPPHGDRTPFIARAVNDHHMRIVMWNDSAGDWKTKPPAAIARAIVRGAQPGSIIILHDGRDGIPTANRDEIVQALPLILEGLRGKNLHVVGLDKLIGGPAYVPCQ